MKIMSFVAAALGIGAVQNVSRKRGTWRPLYSSLPPLPTYSTHSSINKPSSNKFTPHQGKRECARRIRQRLRGALQQEAI